MATMQCVAVRTTPGEIKVPVQNLELLISNATTLLYNPGCTRLCIVGYKSAVAIIFFIVILLFFGHSSGIQLGSAARNHAHKTSNILDFIFVSEALRC